MDDTIRKETVYVTADGEKHSSPEMARQHLAWLALIELFDRHAAYGQLEVDQICNLIGEHRKQIREYLDLTDAMVTRSLS